MQKYVFIAISIAGISFLLLINSFNANNGHNHAEMLIRDFIIQSEKDQQHIDVFIMERKKAPDQDSTDLLTANIRNVRSSLRSQLFLLLNNSYIEKDPALKGLVLRHVVETRMLTAGSQYYIGSAGLKFDGADARGVNFNNAILSNLSLKGINLKGASVIHTNFKSSDLRNMVYDETTIWRQPTFNKKTHFSDDFDPNGLGFVYED